MKIFFWILNKCTVLYLWPNSPKHAITEDSHWVIIKKRYMMAMSDLGAKTKKTFHGIKKNRSEKKTISEKMSSVCDCLAPNWLAKFGLLFTYVLPWLSLLWNLINLFKNLYMTNAQYSSNWRKVLAYLCKYEYRKDNICRFFWKVH